MMTRTRSLLLFLSFWVFPDRRAGDSETVGASASVGYIRRCPEKFAVPVKPTARRLPVAVCELEPEHRDAARTPRRGPLHWHPKRLAVTTWVVYWCLNGAKEHRFGAFKLVQLVVLYGSSSTKYSEVNVNAPGHDLRLPSTSSFSTNEPRVTPYVKQLHL